MSMAQIFYALIIRDPNVVLAECYKVQGNFPQITRNILPRLPRMGRYSYTYNNAYCFHYLSSDNIMVMCLADNNFNRRVSFMFLEDLYTRFMGRYGPVVNTLIAFGANKDFSEVIMSRMNYFNTDSNVDKLESLKSNLDQLRTVMVDNIDKVLARGEKVELLVKKTEIMSENAVTMRRRATQLRQIMWWRNLKIYIYCGVAVVVLLVILGTYWCGITLDSC